MRGGWRSGLRVCEGGGKRWWRKEGAAQKRGERKGEREGRRGCLVRRHAEGGADIRVV